MHIYKKRPFYSRTSGAKEGDTYSKHEIRCDFSGEVLDKPWPTLSFDYGSVDPCWGESAACRELNSTYGGVFPAHSIMLDPFVVQYEIFYDGTFKEAFEDSEYERLDFFLRECKASTILFLIREGVITPPQLYPYATYLE